MAAVTAAPSAAPIPLAQIAQQNRFRILKELADCIVKGKAIPKDRLRIAVQVGEGLFYSQDEEDYKSGFDFFYTILQSGDDEFFQAITPFFLQGRAPCPTRASFYGFDALVKELIAHVGKFESGRAVAIQSLLKESGARDPLARALALENFQSLLSQSKEGKAEIIEAAETALENALQGSVSGSPRLDQAIVDLLRRVAQDRPFFRAYKIALLARKSLCKGVTKSASHPIASLHAVLRSLLPTVTKVQQVVQLAEENPAAVAANPEAFWNLFFLQSRPDRRLSWPQIPILRTYVEKIRPFFQKGSSFLALSDYREGFLIDAALPSPIDLTRRPSTSNRGTTCDYIAPLFDSHVKPFLPAMANALHYECTTRQKPVQFRILWPNSYAIDRDRMATLFQLQKKDMH